MLPEFTIINEITLDELSQNSVSCLLLLRCRQSFSLIWASKEKQLLALNLYLCICLKIYSLARATAAFNFITSTSVSPSASKYAELQTQHQLSQLKTERGTSIVGCKKLLHSLPTAAYIFKSNPSAAFAVLLARVLAMRRVLFRLRLQVGHAPTSPTCLCGAIYKPAATCKSRWAQHTSGQQVLRHEKFNCFHFLSA